MTDRAPMDDIFAEIRGAEPPPPKRDVHARVLTLTDGPGVAHVVACWNDPGGPAALHRDVRDRVEAALLVHLSRPRQALVGAPALTSLRLAMFPEMDAAQALRAFGFVPDTAVDDVWKEATAHLRSEAHAVDATVAEAPASLWRAPIARDESLEAWERKLMDAMGKDPAAAGEVWGARPGAPFARLSAALGLPAEPSIHAFAEAEQKLVRHEPGVLRWIPPLTFQALADGAAVIMAQTLRNAGAGDVQWAVCETDQGVAPPPLVRVAGTAHGEGVHIPLGLEILRWCVMPLGPQEQLPTFTEWLVDCITGLGS